MWLCAAGFVAAVVVGIRWSGRAFRAPPPVDELTPQEFARRFAWYLALAVTVGVLGGIATIGLGGRLAMRILAAVAPEASDGRITEADEVVGEIAIDGTIGFVLFNGIFGGLLVATAWLVVRRAMPPRRAGGLAYGATLLVVLGTTIDPLREDNPDFDLVPGTTSVLVFAALALLSAVAMQGITVRLSEWLPPLEAQRRVIARYALPLTVTALVFPLLLGATAALALGMLVTRSPALVRAKQSARYVLALRAVVTVVVLASLPGAVASIADIVGR